MEIWLRCTQIMLRSDMACSSTRRKRAARMHFRVNPGTRVRVQLHCEARMEARLRFLAEGFSQPLHLPFASVHFSMR
jgi:hypothetical protein